MCHERVFIIYVHKIKKNLLEKIYRYEKSKKHQTTMLDAPGVHVSI